MEAIEIPEGFTASRELGEAARLLDIISDSKYVYPINEEFDTDNGFTIGFNPNSGNVFAYNEDGMTVFAGDKKELILFVSTSWTGQEGTIDEHIENIPYGDYEEDDIDEVRRYVQMSGDEKLIEQFNQAVKEAEEE